MKIKICPICGKNFSCYPAILRIDNKTEICSDCGVREAEYDYFHFHSKKIDDIGLKTYNEEKIKALKDGYGL